MPREVASNRWTGLRLSKVESRGREFSDMTRSERVFLYVGALAMGGNRGVSVAHSWHNCYQPDPSTNIDSDTAQSNERQP